MWPLWLKLTFFWKTNIIIWFLDPKNPLKMVSHIIPVISFFLGIFNIQHIFFDPLGQKRPRLQTEKILRKFWGIITFIKNLTSKTTRGPLSRVCRWGTCGRKRSALLARQICSSTGGCRTGKYTIRGIGHLMLRSWVRRHQYWTYCKDRLNGTDI